MSSDYAVSVMRNLLEFQKSGYLCDTVIAVDDGRLKAHRAVLAAASPVFNTALKENDNPLEPTIELTGVDVCIASVVLQFIYTGDIVVSDNSLPTVKVTELVTVMQELGLKVPAADMRYDMSAYCTIHHQTNAQSVKLHTGRLADHSTLQQTI